MKTRRNGMGKKNHMGQRNPGEKGRKDSGKKAGARLLAALATVMICAPAARAQIGEPRNDLAVGLNGGYTLNRVMFNPTIPQRLKGSPSFGLTLRYTCEKYFKSLCAVQVEVNYANLGWEENIETSSDTYRRNISYIQIPLLARMGWGYEEKGAMFYVVAGPQLGFYLGEKDHRGGLFNDSTLRLRPGQVNQQYDMPVKNHFEYGITAGMGIEVNTRRAGHFLLEGRYYYGLSDIFGNGKSDVFGRSANGTIVIKASYLFDIVRTRRNPTGGK